MRENKPKTQEPRAISADIAQEVLLQGDLSRLSPEQRVEYYRRVCESLGLNPLTKPFQYIVLGGKLTLYATRDAADQLRRRYNISIEIVSREIIDGQYYVVTARARTPDGRIDESIGAVPLVSTKPNPRTGEIQTIRLTGDEYANAIMKCETKAKRRVTLSICGLGWLDESEIETIPTAVPADNNVTNEEFVHKVDDYIDEQTNRRLHALAADVFGRGEDARQRYIELKCELFGENKKTTELTWDEAKRLEQKLRELREAKEKDARGDNDESL
jgi:uncharacterized protein YlxP (DUF503 family)